MGGGGVGCIIGELSVEDFELDCENVGKVETVWCSVRQVLKHKYSNDAILKSSVCWQTFFTLLIYIL